PGAFAGGGVSSMENYAAEVRTRTGLEVPEFEQMLQSALVTTKLRRLVTDGISASKAEIQEEFKRRNEKAKLEYVMMKPSELEARVKVSDADLSSYFEKNKARYQVPEKRAFKYALMDLAALRQSRKPSDAAIQDYYKANIDQYRVQNRVHVEH